MTGRGAPEGRFARAVEDALARIRGGAVVLSPREFSLVARWHARGIPLALVLETIEEIGARRLAKGRPPRTLGYYARAVEESWAAVREGRLEPRGRLPAVPVPRGRADRVESWRREIESRPADDPLHRKLVVFLARLEGGEPSAKIDAALDAALLEETALERERLVALRAAREALAPYRDRMTALSWGRTVERAALDRLRDRLGLPRLGAVGRVV